MSTLFFIIGGIFLLVAAGLWLFVNWGKVFGQRVVFISDVKPDTASASKPRTGYATYTTYLDRMREESIQMGSLLTIKEDPLHPVSLQVTGVVTLGQWKEFPGRGWAPNNENWQMLILRGKPAQYPIALLVLMGNRAFFFSQRKPLTEDQSNSFVTYGKQYGREHQASVPWQGKTYEISDVMVFDATTQGDGDLFLAVGVRARAMIGEASDGSAMWQVDCKDNNYDAVWTGHAVELVNTSFISDILAPDGTN